MKPIVWLLALIWLAACTTTATTATTTAPAPPAGTPAAPTLVWQHTGSQSFERQHPGLGHSDRYTSAAGWIDVYVYGLRRNNWASGVADPQFAAHFDATVAEVRLYAQRGAYVDLQVGTPRDVLVAGHSFRTVNFRYLRDGKPMHSTTYLTARKGQLLKYRISVDAATGADLDAVARRFIDGHVGAEAPGRIARDGARRLA